ncbi:ATP-binding protein [Haloimpatiens sp. FM7330]|uniref:ATP-binding protein n=1 Tax=Haloimpatiens sp. FM7330 TaxID=3298610 RepID=UPI00363FCA6B
MRLKSIYIKDFGIFQNAEIKDISPGLIVIGGKNRAGKTSFMQVLKHLGYGFVKGEDIPEAKIKYDIIGDIVLNDGKDCSLHIEGYKKPQVIIKDNDLKSISSFDIYNNLDFFTYNQLFTISLNELNQLTGNKDEKLQSVLMGAGFKEIILMPKLIENFKKEASKIGRTQGKPNTGAFKVYNEIIKDGKKVKKECLREVDEYDYIVKKYRKVQEELCTYEEEIKDIQAEIIKFDVLKNNLEDYIEVKRLEEEIRDYNIEKSYDENYIQKVLKLKDEYENILQEYEKTLINFKREVSNNLEYKERYISNKNIIKEAYKKMFKIEERLKYYLNEKSNYLIKKNEILKNMKSINENWKDFSNIRSIKYGNIDKGILKENLNIYVQFKKSKEDLLEKIEELKSKKNIIESKLQDEKFEKQFKGYKFYFIMSLIIIVVGILGSFINSTIGIIISLGGLSSVVSYFLYNNNIRKVIDQNKNDVIQQLDELEIKYNTFNSRLFNVNKDIGNLEDSFEEYNKGLKIYKDIHYDLIKEYLDSALNFKNTIEDIEKENRKLTSIENILIKDLMHIGDLVKKIEDIKISKEGNLKDYFETVNDKMENIIFKLNYAEELQKINIVKSEIENKMVEVFNLSHRNVDFTRYIEGEIQKIKKYKVLKDMKNTKMQLESRILQIFKSERIKDAFNINEDEKKSFQILQRAYKDIISKEEVEREYFKLCDEENKKQKIIENLKEESQELKYKINEMNTCDNLEKAQKSIDNARKSLKPLAEKYAVYSASAFLLGKVQEKLLKDVKHNIFNKSSEIFNEITSGSYTDILPPQDLKTLDFKTICRDGQVNDTAKVLSRGTKEQLFLSVRVSKIKEIKPSLPVIFDDCFVNFDVNHIRNTVEVLNKLSKTHQVFILTCHPYMVDFIEASIKNTQYWKLEEGKFSLSNGRGLSQYLMGN